MWWKNKKVKYMFAIIIVSWLKIFFRSIILIIKFVRISVMSQFLRCMYMWLVSTSCLATKQWQTNYNSEFSTFPRIIRMQWVYNINFYFKLQFMMEGIIITQSFANKNTLFFFSHFLLIWLALGCFLSYLRKTFLAPLLLLI